jgi:DUF971 family protein
MRKALILPDQSRFGQLPPSKLALRSCAILMCMPPANLKSDPKSVKVNVTSGTGMDIDWKDGHHSSYSFTYLRDACPCALCDEERTKTGRKPGDPLKTAPGALPMFKPAPKPGNVEGVGKYAIRFDWSDGHNLGMYSWEFLRDICPCPECRAERARSSPNPPKPEARV